MEEILLADRPDNSFLAQSYSGYVGHVKTVKERTFHKHSKNVPISIRNETKKFEFVPEFVLSKEIISIWSRRADSGPNRNNLFSIRQIRERYQNVLFSFQNDIRMFVL